MPNDNDLCKEILRMDKSNPDIAKLQNLCKPTKESSRLKQELKELQKVTDESVDVVMKGIITGLALAIAFLIYTPIQEAIMSWLIGYPVWLSTIITVSILIGIMILISYIYIQIKQFRSKEHAPL